MSTVSSAPISSSSRLRRSRMLVAAGLAAMVVGPASGLVRADAPPPAPPSLPTIVPQISLEPLTPDHVASITIECGTLDEPGPNGVLDTHVVRFVITNNTSATVTYLAETWGVGSYSFTVPRTVAPGETIVYRNWASPTLPVNASVRLGSSTITQVTGLQPPACQPPTTVPDTTVPVTTVPVTTVPVTTVPVTTVPDTTVPGMVPVPTVPVTTVPDTTVPITTVPVTTPPVTTVPDTTVPTTSVAQAGPTPAPAGPTPASATTTVPTTLPVTGPSSLWFSTILGAVLIGAGLLMRRPSRS